MIQSESVAIAGNTPPLVSVLMTAYNREKYIALAVESVLASDYKNLELIIVDDGSTDGTVQIANSYVALDSRVKLYLNKQNLGDYPNRNAAAGYATGKYLKYVDSDDIIYPQSLKIMVDAMEAFPDVMLGLCHFKTQVNEQPFPLLFSPGAAYREHFLNGGLLFSGPSASIIRNDYFKKIGGFSGKRFISDTELWFRIVQQSPVVIMQPSLCWWRVHPGQEYVLGNTADQYLKMNYELNKQYLESPDCPLSAPDKKNAIRNLKNRLGRTLLINLLKFKISSVVEIKSAVDITATDIAISVFPINKFRRLFKK